MQMGGGINRKSSNENLETPHLAPTLFSHLHGFYLNRYSKSFSLPGNMYICLKSIVEAPNKGHLIHVFLEFKNI